MLFVTARDKNEGEVGYLSNDRDVTVKKIEVALLLRIFWEGVYLTYHDS